MNKQISDTTQSALNLKTNNAERSMKTDADSRFPKNKHVFLVNMLTTGSSILGGCIVNGLHVHAPPLITQALS